MTLASEPHTARSAGPHPGRTPEALKRALLDNLLVRLAKMPGTATLNDYYQALAYTVRDQMVPGWLSTQATHGAQSARTVAYLSAEFLIGPQLGNNLLNLGLYDAVRDAVGELGLNFQEILRQEEEPGLGNGGLGRLAACFMDSLATLEVPAIGYGIRYEYGIFYQTIVDGWQVENPDKWLRYGNPWEVQRADGAVEVKLGGRTEHYTDDMGRLRVRWAPEKVVAGVPFDIPVPGYHCHTINTLRLWRAEATEAFDLSVFNRGDYVGAVNKKVTSENLTKVLYPNDATVQGKELRLEQQYFFVSCSLQDMLRTMRSQGLPIDRFHEKYAVQLNDTHPAIGVAELMRLLVDDYRMSWDKAWGITTQAFSYTNHTLLAEALETWPLDLFARILPRHLEIIYEINARFLNEVRIRFLGDDSRIARLSLINEVGQPSVRMAHLASVGSHTVNGVAALHAELLRRHVMADFYEMWPEKFTHVTNGVTHRRWLLLSNPRLSELITEVIGSGWVADPMRLSGLEAHLEDPGFVERWRAVKHANKVDLGRHLARRTGISVDPDSLFDVMVKRMHEYKRQHLAVLHIVTLYHRLKSQADIDVVPRTFVFAGKAAPGYAMAKLMIRLITAVGDVVNHDPEVRDRLKVVFLPNFGVGHGQRVYPAAELSEQISMAGKEASGTGNMKFAMNGAVTIGTMDGANIEIREAVGPENFFLFGLTAEAIDATASSYQARAVYDSNAELRAVIDLIAQGFFSRGDAGVFAPLVQNLLGADPYRVLADYASYIACQEQVSSAYRDRAAYTRMSIRNVARSGWFSSDRSIREYCERIWHVGRVPVALLPQTEPGNL